MAPSIIYNDAVQGEIFLPGQIFVFGGFALRANSLGHRVDRQLRPWPSGQVWKLKLHRRHPRRLDLRRIRACVRCAAQPRRARLNSAVGQCSGDRICNYSGFQSGANRAIREQGDRPRHGGRTLSGDGAGY